MKINLNKEDLAKVKKILQTKNESINISDFILEYIYTYASPLNKNQIKEYIKEGMNPYMAYKEALLEDLGFEDLDKQDQESLFERVISLIRLLDINKYRNNAYIKNINIKPSKYKNWELTLEKYLPYETFIADDVVDLGNYKEGIQLGYFDKEFTFPAVIEDNTIWMSVTPNEIETMEKGLSLAHGKVVTFGLGLGYFAYMASLKEEVEEILIIEKDKKVIELFKQFILPQFKEKKKITIVNIDAYEYLNSNKINDFDYAYVDIWHGAEDGIYHYIKFKKFEKLYPNCQFEYWLEDSLISYYRRIILTLVEESLEDFKQDQYLKAESDYDRLINETYLKTENISFNIFKEFDEYLSFSNLKKSLEN